MNKKNQLVRNHVGRPIVENPRVTISVRVSPELLDEIKSMPNLTLTQAVENGLKLLLAQEYLKE